MTALDRQEDGTKHDSGKPRLDLLSPDALIEVAKVLGAGAAKHGERGWEKGRPYSGEFAAAQRHLLAWHGGEDVDAETGLSHVAHAASRLLILLASAQRGIGTDDRPKVLVRPVVSADAYAQPVDRLVPRTTHPYPCA